jgi:ribonuclease T1
MRATAARYILFAALLCSHSLQAQLLGEIAVEDLPPEGLYTLMLIKRGGPFAYPKDGIIFGNFEKHLPMQPRGYYREYTVKTPRLTHRGPRRIVAGSATQRDVRTSGEYYYTDDHYDSFRRIRE